MHPLLPVDHQANPTLYRNNGMQSGSLLSVPCSVQSSNTVMFVSKVPVNVQDAEDTVITNNIFVGSVDAQFE